MSAPVRTNAVARTKPPVDPVLQAAIDERKQLHLVAAKISEMNWGKGLSTHMQNAVAAYCRENRLDPTEIHILGGNIYRAASYYLRRLSEMLDDGVIEYAKADHVHLDQRLVAAAKGNDEHATLARAELQRRERERVALNIPDAAVAAVIFRVKLRGIDVEFAGAKWTGGGTRKSDPVGDSFPVETAETRACRRCMRYIASQIPHLKWREDEMDDRAAQVSAQLVEERQLQKAREVNTIPLGPPGRYLNAAPDGSPWDKVYGAEAGEGMEPMTAEQRGRENAPDSARADAGDPVLVDGPTKSDERSDANDPTFQDDRELVDDDRRGPAPGSKNVRMPPGGKVENALPLDDRRKGSTDALRNG